MRSKAFAVVTAALVLLVSSPAYATSGYPPEPPPTDNGRWTAVIAFVIFAAVVTGMLFIAKAYLKNNDEDRNR